ncbi:substrate-binding domain-containing protein [Paenibacillus sp. FSL W8-1187]|uniref:ABC-type sugar transport system, periplasmic component n=1 Tax=Paenibacillus pasadenensis TaxID=217090 RepID=A0A2N5N4Z0_9BACL|nr:substrate-binding domain-containing protein [Paenibacillus pasadenensis]PLT45408.1 ABC-type sugar transport system, periplasmic component [Paenibacillus pasadenensis]
MRMKVKKSLFAAACAAILLGGLLALSGSVFDSPKRPVIYMIVKVDREDYEFWRLIRAGAQAAAKEHGCDFVFWGPKYENDAQEQIELVKRAIEKKPDAIIISAVDQYLLSDAAKQVADHGIKLLLLDSDIHSDVSRSFITTDNAAAAVDLGHHLLDRLRAGGEIGIVSSTMNATTAIDREKGFKEAVEASADSRASIAFKEYSQENVDKSYHLTKELLRKNPNVTGLYGVNQQALEGIAIAVRELGVQDRISVVGFDSSRLIIKGLEDGIIQAIVVQKPFNMGYASIISALKDKSETILTGYELITKETMYSPQNEKLLFPFAE